MVDFFRIKFKRIFFLCMCIQVSLCGAASIPNLSPSEGSSTDEGFLWKKAFTVQDAAGCVISFEETHDTLYLSLNDFQSKIIAVVDPVSLMKSVLFDPACPPNIRSTFKELYEGEKSIVDVLGEETEITEETFGDQSVQQIIQANFDRLKRRNFCLASLDYVPEAKGNIQSVPIILETKPVIFISGIGNSIIRILERHSLFNSWSFVIFIEEKTDVTNKHNCISIEHFETSLCELYVNAISVLPTSPTEEIQAQKLVKEYKRDVLKLDEARKSTKKTKEDLKKEMDEYLSDRIDDKEKVDRIMRIPLVLTRAKDFWHQSFIAFRDKFCDSEQALRYFLFAHIESFLAPIQLSTNGILTLNIHSKMDPCQYCTNALFLDCFLRCQSSFTLTKKPLNVSFFQKFYNLQGAKPETERKPMPNVFIFVSSQKLESTGGITRRLAAGRAYITGDTFDSPITLVSPTKLYFRDNRL